MQKKYKKISKLLKKEGNFIISLHLQHKKLTKVQKFRMISLLPCSTNDLIKFRRNQFSIDFWSQFSILRISNCFPFWSDNSAQAQMKPLNSVQWTWTKHVYRIFVKKEMNWTTSNILFHSLFIFFWNWTMNFLLLFWMF